MWSSVELAPADIERYKKDGFLVIESIMSSEACDEIVASVRQRIREASKALSELDKDFPFSDLKGMKILPEDIEGREPFNLFSPVDYLGLGNLATTLSGKATRPWFKKIYLKNAFQGDSEFYHQDYAYHAEKHPDPETVNPVTDYIQCFIALADHKIRGGCLNILKGSHLNGLLPHSGAMTRSGFSKLTIDADTLAKLSAGDCFCSLELSKGSCVFFNYLTVHGSASNSSPIDQPRMVIQFMRDDLKHSAEKCCEVHNARREFEISVLEKTKKSLTE